MERFASMECFVSAELFEIEKSIFICTFFETNRPEKRLPFGSVYFWVVSQAKCMTIITPLFTLHTKTISVFPIRSP